MSTQDGRIDALLKTIEGAIGPLPPRVLEAFRAVDRARFVRPCDRDLAFDNTALPLDTPHGAAIPPAADLVARFGSLMAAAGAGALDGAGSTISQPLIYALAFKLLAIAEGDRLLELGTGTGYGAALGAVAVGASGRVTSVDVDPHLVAAARALDADLPNVTIVHDDGLRRPDLVAAHDKCWLTFSIAERPDALIEALAEGAVLLAPVGAKPPAFQTWIRYQRQGGVVSERTISPVMFIPARGRIEAGA